MKPPKAAPERDLRRLPTGAPTSREARGPEWLPPSHEYSSLADRPSAFGLTASSAIGQRLLTPADVADHCQISTKTVLRAIQSGRLHASRLGSRGAYRLRVEDVDDWLRAAAIVPVSPRPGRHSQPTPVPPRQTSAAGRLIVDNATRRR
jgi:excisionase family DNA binding protein